MIEETRPSSEPDPGNDVVAEVSDAELLARLRAGDDTAFGEVYRRHAGAVWRCAARLSSDSADADDITAEAFFRVLQALRRGNGPDEHPRTYLLTVARRISWEWRARRRDVPTDDEELGRQLEPHGDGAATRAERVLITRAFSSLPERWRTILWHIEVEGERPAVAAPRFGLSPNATAALVRRARDGLRAAYLQAHLHENRSPAECHSVVTRLGAYAAGNLTGAEAGRIRMHMRGCPSCKGLHAELRDVSSALRAHGGLALLPLTGVALAGHQLAGTSATSAVAVAAAKGLVFGARIKLALSAAALAVVGVVGVTVGPPGGGPGLALPPPSFHDGAGQSQVYKSEPSRVLDLTAMSSVDRIGPHDVPGEALTGDTGGSEPETRGNGPASSAATSGDDGSEDMPSSGVKVATADRAAVHGDALVTTSDVKVASAVDGTASAAVHSTGGVTTSVRTVDSSDTASSQLDPVAAPAEPSRNVAIPSVTLRTSRSG